MKQYAIAVIFMAAREKHNAGFIVIDVRRIFTLR